MDYTHHRHPRINESEGQQTVANKSCDDTGQHPKDVAADSVNDEAKYR